MLVDFQFRKVNSKYYNYSKYFMSSIMFSLVDEAGDGKISKTEMKKFLDFANETQGEKIVP